MSPQLSAIDLGYNLPDGSVLFTSLTFSIKSARNGPVRTGMVGANGAGKTTLIDLLAGDKVPARGTVLRSGVIAYLRQREMIDAQATIAAALGFGREVEAFARVEAGEGSEADFELLDGRWDLLERIEKARLRLGVAHLPLDRAIGEVSGGELTRLRLAGALLCEPDFLLLDEPTNHLDGEARRFVYDLVESWRASLLVVSHDRELLGLVDEIAELERDRLTIYGGNFDFYCEQRSIARAAAQAALGSAKLRLKAAKETAQRARERQMKRQAAAARSLAKANIPPILAGGRKRAAERTAGRLSDRHEAKIESLAMEVEEARANVTREDRITIDLEATAVAQTRRLIEFEGVNYRYPGMERMLWREPLDFEITGPERIRLHGPNGAGKSTLIDLICGRKDPEMGRVVRRTGRIGLLDQPVSVLDPELTLFGNLKRLAPERPDHELRTLLGRFLFAQEAGMKMGGVLSGGERMRAGLVCLLGADQAPELLILDEPTNNLDLASIEELTSVLVQYRGALVVVSHDETFCEEIGLERVINLGADDGRDASS